jgi:hypothetical protein
MATQHENTVHATHCLLCITWYAHLLSRHHEQALLSPPGCLQRNRTGTQVTQVLVAIVCGVRTCQNVFRQGGLLSPRTQAQLQFVGVISSHLPTVLEIERKRLPLVLQEGSSIILVL